MTRAMTMTEDREKLGLSLCPFCGGTARFGKCVPGEQESENDEAEYIECCDCGASTCLVFPLMDSAKQVLRDMWNRRTEAAMKVELTKEWCMNMAKIEARAAELHEGCRMPMEQARELAASEMSEGRKALLAAFGAAAAAREQGLRGQYPKAATVLAEEVFSLRAALRQKQAEYDDMKSLLLGNVRNVHLEGERAREVLRRLLEAPTTQITSTWKDAARFALRLGPDDLAAIERIKDDIKARAAQEAAYLSTDLGDFLLHVIDRCKGEHEWDAVRLNAEALLKRAAIVFGPNVELTGRPVHLAGD